MRLPGASVSSFSGEINRTMRLSSGSRRVVLSLVTLIVSLSTLFEIWNQARYQAIAIRLRLDQQHVSDISFEIERTERQRLAGANYDQTERMKYLQARMLNFGVDYPESWAEESQGLRRMLVGYRDSVTQKTAELAVLKQRMLFP